MSSVEEKAQAFAATLVRAHEVTVGKVKGWQVQRFDLYGLRWTSSNVMCSREEALAEVEERIQSIAKWLLENPQP